MKNSLVILGGMGPQASLELHRLLIEKTSRKANTPDKFPNILHASMAVPDFISDASASERAVKIITETCASLPLQKATAIGMACNTAHLLLNDIPHLQNDRFISMIDAVCGEVEASDCKTVGILASPFTINSRLYETPLKKCGLDVLTPKKSELDELASIIRLVISGEKPSSLRSRLTKLSDDLKNRGADCVVLGCTELPLIGISTNLPIFSSLDALASALLTRHTLAKVV